MCVFLNKIKSPNWHFSCWIWNAFCSAVGCDLIVSLESFEASFMWPVPPFWTDVKQSFWTFLDESFHYIYNRLSVVWPIFVFYSNSGLHFFWLKPSKFFVKFWIVLVCTGNSCCVFFYNYINISCFLCLLIRSFFMCRQCGGERVLMQIKKNGEEKKVARAKGYDWESHNSYLEQEDSFGLCRDTKISKERK